MEKQGLIIVMIIIIIIWLNEILKREFGKGELGEYNANKKLSKLKKYNLIYDVMLKTTEGTYQIDHILVGPKGIFVIETKNYNGYIYGNEWDYEWTQALFGRRNKFYNPIRQNYGHVKAVESIIPKNYRHSIYSVILFGDECKLKKVKTKTPVLYIRQVRKYINNFEVNNLIEEDEINHIVNKLNKANIKNKRARKKHIKSIKKRVK